MLVHGRNRNPVITGSSVHNQRVERLWRDTYRCAIALYYQIFYYLEDLGELDPDSDLDLLCLHLVYNQKINYALTSFMDGWNSHALSTERNMTPTQLFTCGVLMRRNLADAVGLPDGLSGNTLQSNLSIQSVVVPPTPNPLASEQLRELSLVVDRHVQSETPGDYSIEAYLLVKRQLTLFLAQ